MTAPIAGCCLSALVTLGFLVGCDQGAPAPPSRAEVSDSARVHRTDFDLLFDRRVPEWSLVDVLSTVRLGIELHRVVGARLLTDGSVVIANSGSFEILRLSPSGHAVFRTGRYGEGPGEFRALTSVDVSPSDQLLAYDARLGRLSIFDQNGELIDTRLLSTENAALDLVPLAFSSDGAAIATYGAMRMFGPAGVARDSVPLLRYGPGGVGQEILGYWLGKQWAFAQTPRGVARAPLAFTRDVSYAGRNGRAVIASTDSVNLTVVHATDSSVWRIRSRDTGETVSQSLRQKWIADATRRFESGPAELRDLVIRNVPSTYPTFEALVIDDSGRVWIGEYPPESAATRRWVAVTYAGEIAGAVALPRRSRILDIVGDQLVVLDLTDLDEESVRIARVEN